MTSGNNNVSPLYINIRLKMLILADLLSSTKGYGVLNYSQNS